MKSLEMSRPTLPPSVLPDISPARGEIGSVAGFANLQRGRMSAAHGGRLISPLAGGPQDGPRPVARARASGRTEGGNVENHLSCSS